MSTKRLMSGPKTSDLLQKSSKTCCSKNGGKTELILSPPKGIDKSVKKTKGKVHQHAEVLRHMTRVMVELGVMTLCKKVVSSALTQDKLSLNLGEVFPEYDFSGISPSLKRAVRSMISGWFHGIQEPLLYLKTAPTSLVTTATPNLIQVVPHDITGVSGWSSFALCWDEYQIHEVVDHSYGVYALFGTAAPVDFATWVVSVFDRDDSTALASLANAYQFDTARLIPLTSSSPKVHVRRNVYQGIPDKSWVTTATPVVTGWTKYWAPSNLIPNNQAVGLHHLGFLVKMAQDA